MASEVATGPAAANVASTGAGSGIPAAAGADADALVLVTGVSGYIASHCAQQLLAAGYRVRGTVRSLKDEGKIKHLCNLCPGSRHSIELVEADLLAADTWPAAVAGCKYVLHLASPFPVSAPKDEMELIRPAREGSLNVLRAVAAASPMPKRVVLTRYVLCTAVACA